MDYLVDLDQSEVGIQHFERERVESLIDSNKYFYYSFEKYYS